MNAPEKAKEIRGAVAAVAGFLTALWGWLGWAVIIWVMAIVADYVSGSMAARRQKNWDSSIARDGLWHKAGEIFAVLVAAMCDIAIKVMIEGSGVQLPFTFTQLITPVVLLWYILTEFGSIIENCGKLGAPVPSWFKKRVDSYKDAIDREQEPETAAVQEPIGRHEAGRQSDKQPDEQEPEDEEKPDDTEIF